MKRRDFLTLTSSLVVAPVVQARAQVSGRISRIGRLSPLSSTAEEPMMEALKAGLQELGWVEGKNFIFEYRFADGVRDRLPSLAADLAGQKVDVIVAGSTPGALAAKLATTSIPIVFVTTGDPVLEGIVASLSRPSSNLTGVTTLGLELNRKRLQLLKELIPDAKHFAVLTDPGSNYSQEFRKSVEPTSRILGLDILLVEVHDTNGFTGAFDKMAAARADALLVLSDVLFIAHRQPIIDLAAKIRIPTSFPERAFVLDGGLMFYGSGLPDMYRHAAIFVDKILKGAKPADLPVEQPTRLEMMINLKTAKSFGLSIPLSIISRADEVIE